LCVEEDEHFFEAFDHEAIAGLLFSSIVCRIESGEYVATGVGPSRKLGKKRGK
jgi:methenyltetrahydromethanopterin cyclohydrolase